MSGSSRAGLERLLARLWPALSRWRARRRHAIELDEELAFHRDCRIEELVARGLSPDEAARQAQVELGMVELHRHEIDRVRGSAFIDGALTELGSATRALLRRPAYPIAAITLLGLATATLVLLAGIHANYVGGLPSALRDAALVDLQLRNDRREPVPGLSDRDLDALQPALGTEVRAWLAGAPVRLTADAGGRTAYGTAVRPGYFEAWRPQLALGRALTAGDAAAAATPSIVLSDGGWRALAAADPAVVGRSLTLGGDSYTVVGVLAPGQAGLDALAPQFWLPAEQFRLWQARHLVAAEPPLYAVTAVLAGPDAGGRVAARIAGVLNAVPERGAADARVAVALPSRQGRLSAAEAEDLGIALLPVLALLLVLLLVASANLSGLMVGRLLAQRSALALRASLGASPWRLLRATLIESGVVGGLAALFALALVAAAAEPLHRHALGLALAEGLEPLPLRFDGTAALLALLAPAAALICGLVAHQRVLGGTARAALRDSIDPASLRGSRLRRLLLIAQVGSSHLLLVVAALLLVASGRVAEQDLGYAPRTLVALQHPAPDAALRARVEQVGGVRGSTRVARVPLSGIPMRADATVDGVVRRVGFNLVDERYFATVGIDLVAGRAFRHGETGDADDGVVVSAATAAALWPGRSPLGAPFELDLDGSVRRVRVLGVAADVASGLAVSGLDASMVYLPLAESTAQAGELLLRVEAVSPALRAELGGLCLALAPHTPCEPRPLVDLLDRQLLPVAVARQLASTLAAVALVLCLIGLYGATRWQVESRRREIGVRIALGAGARSLWSWVYASAFAPIRIGLAFGVPLGLGVALLASRVIGPAAAFSPLAHGLVVLLLVGSAAAIVALPAWRASRVEAMHELCGR